MKLNKELLKLYLEKKLDESQKFLDIFYIIGTVLYLGFWIADYIQFYAFRYEFLIIRLGFCLLAIAAFFHNKFKSTYVKNQIWQLVLTFYGSSGITYMMMRTDGPTSIYFSGLNLVAIISLMFATYQTSLFITALTLTYLPYFVLCFFEFEKLGFTNFSIHAFFILGTIFSIIFARDRRENALLDLLTVQLELEDIVRNRERVIEIKTEEATKLNQLSAQFSPQIVKAIKEGSINLQEGVHRSKICAIFVDIVNSTERVVRLDQEKVQLVLARFLDTTLTTFLKYDLTIDKFHGDGVLAFSNDPVKREDFIERVCLAAIEVRKLIDDDRDFYLSNWKNEMQVRIGIAAGYANVGFYGDKKYFRSFTAIGAPLPFASRLTGIAEPNQILIDSNIAEILKIQKYSVSLIGERLIKGFELDKNLIYALIDAPLNNRVKNELKSCPNHPESILFLDNNEKGHLVFKCRECDYSDSTIRIKAA